MPGLKSKFLNRINCRSWSVKPRIIVGITIDDCAVAVDVDTQRFSDTNSVGNLDHASFAESVSNQVLSNPPSSISSRSINLRRVLTRESTSTMSSPTSISITDNLPASQARIASGSSNNEGSARVEDVLGIFQ